MATAKRQEQVTSENVEGSVLPTLILTGSVKIAGEYHGAKSKIDTDDRELHAALLASGAAKKFLVVEKDEVLLDEETGLPVEVENVVETE
ncbi:MULTISPECIES: hypothetical protein [unclassified Ensifer]|uniref:hypothetical protein n=1 Tax=unclassified Ensifer TaxID=2633371 RepID=UPI0008138CE9|nr:MULTISPECIES: hypothetical protein [unclassified Ensifer]OCP07980.1 hypothetical protein BC362_10240 [Ensifer sp. LC14]OCP10910.1 hypothetical protein BC374_17725 [Ensifer sp. LC13]OCP11544.1 hypothetical protein BBX50_18130 [Ensifer sp. LC11]OCP33363.1 hypothetical protein BC364_17020 [Ensifer sp. LC499]